MIEVTRKNNLEDLVEMSKKGDKNALEELIRQIKDRLYGLALRMLYHPADAEDATQEILIKIITQLDRFEGKSRFHTWAFRIASNHLLTTRQRRAEKINLDFKDFDQLLNNSTSPSVKTDLYESERSLLVEEVKLICTQGLLLCLRRGIRLAFIIGEVFGGSSQEGAEILNITKNAFRQRLSRGRKLISEFMTQKCSLVNPKNPCYCSRLIDPLIKEKSLNPKKPLFIKHPCKHHQKEETTNPARELDELGRITAIFRSHPDYSAPEAFVNIIKELVDSGKYQLLTAN